MYVKRPSTEKPLTLTQKMSPLLLCTHWYTMVHKKNPLGIPLRLRALAPLRFIPLLLSNPTPFPRFHSPTPQNPPPFRTFQSQPQKPSAISTFRFRNFLSALSVCSVPAACPDQIGMSRLHAAQQAAAPKIPKTPPFPRFSIADAKTSAISTVPLLFRFVPPKIFARRSLCSPCPLCPLCHVFMPPDNPPLSKNPKPPPLSFRVVPPTQSSVLTLTPLPQSVCSAQLL
jgi:hypothetical protein